MNRNRLPRFDYQAPETLEQLLTLKGRLGQKAVILAGGTDVIPELKRRKKAGLTLIDVKKAPELKTMTYSEQTGLTVGAAVVLRDLMENRAAAEKYPLLVRAARAVAYNQIRNMATLGGNICLDVKCDYYNRSDLWWESRPACYKRLGRVCYSIKGSSKCMALSAADTAPALLVYKAKLTLAGPGGYRETDFSDFYTGSGLTPVDLAEDEILVSVTLPPTDGNWREAFIKKSHRGAVDFALASLALRIKPGPEKIEQALLALNGVSTRPVWAEKTADYLIGKSLGRETMAEASRLLVKEAAPISAVGGEVMVRRRAIEAAFEDAAAVLLE